MPVEKIKAAVGKIQQRIEDSKDEGSNPPWVKQVAMLTGVLAAVSGFLAVRATTLTNDAIYESNRAILAQTESSDAWNEYQADSIKAHVVETAIAASPSLSAAKREEMEAEAKTFRDRQPDLKKTGTDKAAKRDEHLHNGRKRLDEKDVLGYAEVAAQVGIALASVAALVRMRMAFYFGVALGVGSILITAYAFATHYNIAP
ncbi:MAG TPA: DUF4337 family protein [Alphaproteobacteria bacterium]|nr:DUF4337 family protein [Alphaproteobacteria bacterium]